MFSDETKAEIMQYGAPLKSIVASVEQRYNGSFSAYADEQLDLAEMLVANGNLRRAVRLTRRAIWAARQENSNAVV